MKVDSYNTKKILAKNLISLLLIIFIPLLTLSSLSIVVTQHYINNEVNKNNMIMLNQASQKIDLIFNDLDTFNLNFGVDPNMIVELDNIFNKPSLSFEDYQILNIVKSFIDSSSQVKPYVHSIYIYHNNVENWLVSSDQLELTNLNNYYDKQWYETYKKNLEKSEVYSEVRDIQMYSFERKQSIVTLYKNLFTSNPKKADGVIVLNINTDYLRELLIRAVSDPNEGFVVVNEDKTPVISNNIPSSIRTQDLVKLLTNNKNFFTYSSSGNSYTISKYYSAKYGWTFISVTPNQTLYEVPRRLFQITLVFFLLSLIMGVLLASYMTRINYLSFIRIKKILDAAKEGLPLPSTVSRMKDEHSYIIQTIIKVFIEQNYLKMQLSERKYRLKVMELLALQSQINPHFLYNTLHTITWKAIALTKKPNEVSGMIENLSTILQYALSSSNETVSLDEEIYYTMCYVNIQSVRYSNQFTVKWKYDVNLAKVRIIKLLLQPLIENSIYHGIKEKGMGTIAIKIVRDRTHLKIWLVDNGLGITADKMKEIKKIVNNKEEYVKNAHIGLFNVNKRLMLTYGEEYRVKIKSVHQRGTAIYIRIPIEETEVIQGMEIERTP